MTKPKETLSSLFAPPEKLHGIGGVLCGFSSDEHFLEQALFRFTRVPPSSRRSRGSVDFTLMLDPAHVVFAQDVVPGLFQLTPKLKEKRTWKKFHNMHAKVAILAFGPALKGKPSLYRILVSTGNWTKASAQQFIEMVWYIDIQKDSPKEDKWELHAVASFLQGVLECYQSGESYPVHKLIANATAFGAEPPAKSLLRFMQSSSEALLPQIVKGLTDRAKGCNYLVCGSAFFEQKYDPQAQPEVLSKLVEQFQEKGILKQSIENKVLVTNGGQEDQVIVAYKADNLGWKLHHPKDPVSDNNPQPRSQLHAKFIFVAKKPKRADSLSNCWLYLGSGNLSKRGMLLKPSNDGNIEAGVLIEVAELDSHKKVLRLLPVGKKYELNDLDEVNHLAEPTSKNPDQPPSPIIYFLMEDDRLSIKWDQDVKITGELVVVLPDGARQILMPKQESLDLNFPDWPRSLEIQWDGISCKVPCLDDDGNFKQQTIKNPSFENWLALLKGFPETLHDPDPDEEEETEIEMENPADLRGVGVQNDLSPAGRDFPAHNAMILVETIADHNGKVEEAGAADWIHYLRHVLLEVCHDSQIKGWQSLKVNFLTILLERDGFAPEWNDLEEYRKVIRQVAEKWGLDKFPALEMKV